MFYTKIEDHKFSISFISLYNCDNLPRCYNCHKVVAIVLPQCGS